MSQVQEIKAHLDKGYRLTALGALAKFGCMRLAARCHEIRNEGYPVNVTMIDVKGKKVAQYWKGKK